jgi:hypothetical protein
VIVSALQALMLVFWLPMPVLHGAFAKIYSKSFKNLDFFSSLSCHQYLCILAASL